MSQRTADARITKGVPWHDVLGEITAPAALRSDIDAITWDGSI